MTTEKGDKWVIMASQLSYSEAHIMKGLLESNDIAVQLLGEHFASVSPYLGRAVVVVKSQELANAWA